MFKSAFDVLWKAQFSALSSVLWTLMIRLRCLPAVCWSTGPDNHNKAQTNTVQFTCWTSLGGCWEPPWRVWAHSVHWQRFEQLQIKMFYLQERPGRERERLEAIQTVQRKGIPLIHRWSGTMAALLSVPFAPTNYKFACVDNVRW